MSRVPVGAVMSAWEVLSWIAFKEIRTNPPTHDFRNLVGLCGNDSPARVLEALEARALQEPYCALKGTATIRPDLLDRDNFYQRSRAFSRDGPALLRRVYWNFRRRERRSLSLAELIKILGRELAIQFENMRLVTWARLELEEAIANSRVTAVGRAQRLSGGDAMHSVVSPGTFVFSGLIITEWGTISQFDLETGPYRYRDVRFLTSQILSLWQPSQSNSGELPPELANDPKAVEAFEAMVQHQKARVENRDSVAKIVAKKTGCTVRLGRTLYKHLPAELRNPARKLSV